MKKLLVLVAILSILGMVGKVYADGIPVADDPKNYPVVWTANVYNGSGSDIVSGYIAQWDFDTSNSTALDGAYYDDMCPWVKLNATDEGVWQAGVVPYGKDIANGDTGSIIIRGPAYVYIKTTALTADALVASDANGSVSPFDGGANDESTIGVCIKATTTNGPGGGGTTSDWGVIFVNPAAFDEN